MITVVGHGQPCCKNNNNNRVRVLVQATAWQLPDSVHDHRPLIVVDVQEAKTKTPLNSLEAGWQARKPDGFPPCTESFCSIPDRHVRFPHLPHSLPLLVVGKRWVAVDVRLNRQVGFVFTRRRKSCLKAFLSFLFSLSLTNIQHTNTSTIIHSSKHPQFKKKLDWSSSWSLSQLRTKYKH